MVREGEKGPCPDLAGAYLNNQFLTLGQRNPHVSGAFYFEADNAFGLKSIASIDY